MANLTGKIAVVTGASRGVGKGIALGLGEAGATVVITGRTVQQGESAGDKDLAGSIYKTADEVAALGGSCIAFPCDHRNDTEVESVFEQVFSQYGVVDVLVNNAWGGYEAMIDEEGEYNWEHPFWMQPMWRWDAMFQAGVRAAYFASRLVSPSMINRRGGLIVNISFWAAQKYMANVSYGVAKAATDKMTLDMAHELRPYSVAAVSLYPGLVRTEAVLRAAEFFDMSISESPQFVGRAVAALAGDTNIMEKSGQVLVSAALAQEYGFQDVDGKVPLPATVATV
jgi:dehydrogenase/reductase SDR family protein 1